MQENDLSVYISRGLVRLVSSVLAESAFDKSGRRFLLHQLRVQKRKIRLRNNQGIHIPPFLIASITGQCNLHCKGCYARGSGFCTDVPRDEPLSAGEWMRIFSEAEELGISAVLLAGGEPFMNREVLFRAAEISDMIFPVFTNGTLFDDEMLALFSKSRNLFPVFSIEGDSAATDFRRGAGVFAKASAAASALHASGVLFGVSVTVTAENIASVSSDAFFAGLAEAGAAVVFLIEYTASHESERGLELSGADRKYLSERLTLARMQYRSLWFLSFPGDENLMGGCLAAGRGFFHINPFGAAEPCPFSPFSDRNLKTCSLKEAISSPLFKRLSAAELTRIPHEGGCALAGRADEVSALVRDSDSDSLPVKDISK
ncbi:MAG TPA: radical SAM protein [Methanocorpusculum sp.]|nr:radical SAM protein [Methanocorpusculum sp.]